MPLVESEELDGQVAALFQVLAEPARVSVVRMLSAGPRRAGKLAEAAHMSAPAMSKHLRVLLESGLVSDERRAEDARLRIFRLRPEPIAALLRRSGLDAEYRHGDVTVVDLERAVDGRQPPMVDLQAWTDHATPYRETWDAGHYVLMVGYDAERLFFADPSTMSPHGYVFLPRAELDERWHDLTGIRDDRVERMAIFARGAAPPVLDSVPPLGAVKLL